jgi:outer membrane lipoprotein-sorting protein
MKRVLFAAALFALVCTGRAGASTLNDFADAWAKVNDYTCQITTHETVAADVQDRVYDFAFKKPHTAKIDITGGAGKGGGSIWHGGDTVVGHQGGLLRGIKLTVSITDPRATSLRGDTIESASFGSILGVYQSGKGILSESTIDTISGSPVDTITLTIANPSANKDVSKDVLFISRVTHLPVRRVRYEGNIVVKQEDFVNIKINPGLKDSDFQ